MNGAQTSSIVMNNHDFTGKVALVTGGPTGIGRATAEALVKEGASVILSSRTSERGEAAAQALAEAGGTVRFVRADVDALSDDPRVPDQPGSPWKSASLERKGIEHGITRQFT